MAMTEYRVRLSAFEGPLDLLLHLIRRAEVEITDIPIAAIADQFLDSIRGLAAGSDEGELIDVDMAGEFLVMAATLMEIKSRMLMPAEEGGADEAGGLQDGQSDDGSPGRNTREREDPRADLVRQLLAYKRYRDAADRLDERRRDWETRYPGLSAAVDDQRVREAVEAAGEGALELEEIGLVDLAEAFARIIDTVDFDRIGEHHVFVDETPIEIHAADLLDHLRSARSRAGDTGATTFESVFKGRTRAEMIGLFLAMLELVRQRRVAVRQDDARGEILIELREDEEGHASDRDGQSAGHENRIIEAKQ